MKEQIISLLASGISTQAVASAAGVDPSYVSQIAGENAEEILSLKAEKFAAFIGRDEKLERAEEAVLDRTITLIPFITRPAEAARVYGVLNAARRKTSDGSAHNQPVGATVNITLSQAAAVQFTVTHDRQVIELEGRSMTTLPAKNVEQRLKDRSAQRLLSANVPVSLVSKL